jgi:ribonuclease III family protein
VESERINSDKITAQRSSGSLFSAEFTDLSFLPADAVALGPQVSPAALAYLGDAVYELYVRAHYLIPPKRLQDYHAQVVTQVRAEGQAFQLGRLHPHLTTAEQEILRRGRNAASSKSKRGDPKTYQQATSLETLIGYLYLTDPQRLFQLLAHLDFMPEAGDRTCEDLQETGSRPEN